MRVFIVSLVLAVSSVHSLAINYPYQGQLLSYKPARGEFPVYNDLAQGNLRYYDNDGAERYLRYTYPEPLYGVRRNSYSFGSDGNQLVRTQAIPETGFTAASYYQFQENDELSKAREENFRRWCEQRYQALKAEMDKLRAEGSSPSPDMMKQLEPLEKIISGTSKTAIWEAPEIKRLHDEHLSMWNEARLKVLQQEANHLRFQHTGNKYATTYGNEIAANINTIVGETAEQKKAREEHMRIYNEQLAKVKQFEAAQKLQQGNFGAIILKEAPLGEPASDSFKQAQVQQITQISDTPEVIKAREEHLRLVEQAKLRAQAKDAKNVEDDGSYKAEYHTESGYQYGDQNIRLVSGVKQPMQQTVQISQAINLDAQNIKFMPGVQQPKETILGWKSTNQGQQQAQQTSILRTATAEVQIPQQPSPIQDTPEVIRAREEHLRLFNEAKLKAEQSQERIDASIKFQEVATSSNDAIKFREEERRREEEKLRELERSREMERQKQEEKRLEAERLRLKLEEEKRMEMEQKRLMEAKGIITTTAQGSISSDFISNQQQAERLSGAQQTSILRTPIADLQTPLQPSPVQDTPEVMKAREEHFRLFNEAKLKAEQSPELMDASIKLQETEKASLYTASSNDAEKLREEKRVREEQRLLEADRLREAERMREEEKIREMERLREVERRKEEEKKLEAERLRLKFEEEKRMEMEQKRLIESQGIIMESGRPLQYSNVGSDAYSTVGFTSGGVAGSGFVLSSQYKNNPYLLRFAAQPGTTAYIIGGQEQTAALKSNVASPNRYYLPSTAGAVKEAPLYLRYTLNGLQSPDIKQQVATATLNAGTQQIKAAGPFIAGAEKISTYGSSSSSGSSTSSSSSSASNLKLNYYKSTDAAALSELEKATREHFRAHEQALENLRLANANTAITKDCN